MYYGLPLNYEHLKPSRSVCHVSVPPQRLQTRSSRTESLHPTMRVANGNLQCGTLKLRKLMCRMTLLSARHGSKSDFDETSASQARTQEPPTRPEPQIFDEIIGDQPPPGVHVYSTQIRAVIFEPSSYHHMRRRGTVAKSHEG